MDDFRSKSFGDGRMQMEAYGSRGPPPPGTSDLRCYSASYATSYQPNDRDQKPSTAGRKSLSKSGSWSLSDPELQRKKRVAAYKAYAMEGKMKGTLRSSFRWIRERCSGWW